MRNMNRSPLLRKSILLPKLVSRFFKRLFVNGNDYLNKPPIIANSFPKSGTHLLLQILKMIPQAQGYGAFIASMPTIPFRERSKGSHIGLLMKVVPGEVVPAHLFYDPCYQSELAKRNCIHFFIYRDLRDVAVSEAYYLTDMNKWHRMHYYFANNLSSMEERISAAILGISDPNFPYDYPDISKRFSRYRGWLYQRDVCSVKYEDLMSNRRVATLYEIAQFWVNHSRTKQEIDKLVQKMEAGIEPKKSHTYRKGRIGGWRDCFSERHKEQMKSVAGDLLVELGYEEDLNW
jgi:hypothetical protein